MSEPERARARCHRFYRIETRWMDNDVYGHINNAVFYSFFDTAVNNFLMDEASLGIHDAPVIAYVVASSAQYYAPLAYPVVVEAGLWVNQLGNSSVEFGVSVFAVGEEQAAVTGTFTHVFVDRVSERPVSIPPDIRQVLEGLLA